MMQKANIPGIILLLLLALICLPGCPHDQAADSVSGAAAASPSNETPDATATQSQANTGESDGRAIVEAKPDFPIMITASFTSAKHTGKPGALSELGFSFVLKQDTKQLASTELALPGTAPAKPAQFDLPEYRIQLTPLIDPPIELEKGKYGSYGGYRVEIQSPTLEPMAVFEVDNTGKLTRADRQGGFSINLLLVAPSEQLYCYSILPPGGSLAVPLLAIDLQIGEFESQSAKDTSDTYDYRFPSLVITVHGAVLAKELQLTRGTDQRAVEGGSHGGGRRGGGMGRGGGGGRRGGGG